MSRLVAVTGATGFVGQATVAALAAAGWRLRLLVRRAKPAALQATPDAELILGDLDQHHALARLVEGAELVVHLAGAVSAATPAAFMATNRDGTERLCRAIAATTAPPRLLMVSSLAARHPDLSPYAASKRAAEEVVQNILPPSHWVILRPSAIYGPGDHATLPFFQAASLPVVPLPAFRQARICMIHLADAAAAITALAANWPPGGRVELSDERVSGYSWRELITALAAALGNDPRLLPLPPLALRSAALASEGWGRLMGRGVMFSRGKAREMLHADWGSAPDRQPPRQLWAPTIPLAAGLADTVRWYRRAGWL